MPNVNIPYRIAINLPSVATNRPMSAVSKGSFIDYDTPVLSANRLPFNPKQFLSEWESTSIAGNDLLSSILYTIGLTGVIAGKWTPLCLLIVSAMVLFPFKRIYSEIGSAMPQNGGTFNLVLQLLDPYIPISPTSSFNSQTTTLLDLSASTSVASPSPLERTALLKLRSSKFTFARFMAAVAGVLSLLSYVTTAVVSAASAVAYGAGEFQVLAPYEYYLTLIILAIFALVTFMGLKESSKVAYVIFMLHLMVFSVLFITGLCHAVFVERGRIWWGNFVTSDWDFMKVGIGRGDAFQNIFLGVSVGMLGITGYETASNYIEEQGLPTFRKTLYNLLILVTVLNPGLAFICLGVVPLEQFKSNSGNLLSVAAEKAVGPSFRYIIATDAVLALSGGALTAYVGVMGLITRMTQEGMFPSVLLKKNRKTKSYQYIILAFFILTSSLYMFARGNISSLAGVYTISFLGVLSIAILGCVIIRWRLGISLTKTWDVWTATIGILAGLVGQIIFEPSNFLFFFYYFTAFVIFIIVLMSIDSYGL